MNPWNAWGREFAAPLSGLQDDLHRLYEHYRRATGPPDGPAPAWTPAVDLFESPEEIGLLVDLPGVDPATVEVSVTGRVLTLRGDRPRDPTVPVGGQTLERPYGLFSRQVDLPADVDVEAVRAEARHGVISIRLPKVAAARPRTIPIHPGG